MIKDDYLNAVFKSPIISTPPPNNPKKIKQQSMKHKPIRICNSDIKATTGLWYFPQPG